MHETLTKLVLHGIKSLSEVILVIGNKINSD